MKLRRLHLLFFILTIISSTALAAEKAVGTSCSSDQNTADYDTIAQCSSGTFVRANPFLAQTIGIGTTAATTGAVLDMGSTTSSMLLPVGTTGQEPTGIAGMIRYNTSISDVEYYNGSAWTPFKAAGAPSGSGYLVYVPTHVDGCMNVLPNSITYSGTTATLTTATRHYFSNGASVTISGMTPAAYNGTFTITVTGPYTFTYTMLSNPGGNAVNAYNGYMCGSGGLATANAYCLGELTNSSGWFGQTQAIAYGLLNSTHVKSFLCDGTTCNNLNANTTYYYANSQDSTAGGSKFTTDGSGLGPGDSLDWTQAARFASGAGGQTFLWTGRASTSNTQWANSSVANAANTCSAWTSVSSGSTAEYGLLQTGVTTNLRWTDYTQACSTNYAAILCLVNP